jgi:hypothetical protein
MHFLTEKLVKVVNIYPNISKYIFQHSLFYKKQELISRKSTHLALKTVVGWTRQYFMHT